MTPRERAAEQKRRIEGYASDPVAFRNDLLIKSGRGTVRFGDVMADFQRRDFAIIDQAFSALAVGQVPSPSRLWLERTKGASKDSDLAAAILWLFAFTPRPLVCQVGAADQDQAQELRKAARDILNLNPWLGERGIEIRAASIINGHDSTCDILTADATGSHGARPDLVILNECSHVKRKEFAETLFDNAAKVPNGVVVVATNAGFTDTWQHKWMLNARTSDRWYYSAYNRPAPWIDPAEMEEAERRGPSGRYRRLWHGVWSGQSDDPAIAADDLKAATAGTLPPAGREPGWAYYGGVDLGHTRDAAAFVAVARHVGHSEQVPSPNYKPLTLFQRIAAERGDYVPPPEFDTLYHPGTGRIRVVKVSIWKPTPGRPVPFDDVEATIRGFHSLCPLSFLYADPWNAVSMMQRWVKDGIPGEMLDFRSVPNLQLMATDTLDCFRDRLLEIPADLDGADDLIADIKALQVIETEKGFRLKTPRRTVETGTRHGDSATALSLALVAARRFGTAAPSNVIDRPLVCYP